MSRRIRGENQIDLKLDEPHESVVTTDTSDLGVRLWHVVSFLLAIPLAYLSDRYNLPRQAVESLKMVLVAAAAVVAGVYALQRFLRSTRGVPNARKKAIAEYLDIPDEREPEPSRRLWLWQCLLYVLLVPGAYFLVSFPVLSFASLVALGLGRILIARRRRESGGSPNRVGMVPLITYLGFLLVSLGSLVLSLS